MQRSDKEYFHGQLGVEAARIQGILPDSGLTWKVKGELEDDVDIADDDTLAVLHNWQLQMERSSAFTNEDESNSKAIRHRSEPEIIPISELQNQMTDARTERQIVDETESLTPSDVENLNDDQR